MGKKSEKVEERAPEVVLPALALAGVNIKALEARVAVLVAKYRSTGVVPTASIANEVREKWRETTVEALCRLAAVELAARADIEAVAPEAWNRGVGVRN